MRSTLNVLLALGLVLLIGLDLYPQLGDAIRSSTSPPRLKGQYTEETIQTFLDHGFGTPNGSSGSVVRKWKADIRVRVYGTPQGIDTQFLQTTVEQLGSLINPTRISLVDGEPEEANFHIHIIPRALFSQTLSQYNNQRQRSPAFSWCHWNGDSEMTKATLLIDSGLDTVTRHNELLRLLARNLGLIGFTLQEGESVFTDASRTDYSPLDQNMIQLLYETPLLSGMTREQALGQLSLAGALPSKPTLK
jgi:hypothetical protein